MTAVEIESDEEILSNLDFDPATQKEVEHFTKLALEKWAT